MRIERLNTDPTRIRTAGVNPQETTPKEEGEEGDIPIEEEEDAVANTEENGLAVITSEKI